MSETKLTPQERAMRFNKSTRQNLQSMAKQIVTVPYTTMEFQLPKNRYLTNIFVRVKAKVKVKHASGTALAIDAMTPYKIVRQYVLDLNNGFKPFAIGGDSLATLNLIQPKANALLEMSDYYDAPSQFKASADGTENEFAFTVQLPVTLNERDFVGILMLQSEQLTAHLRLDIGSGADMFEKVPTGYTIDLVSVEAQPTLETFSIPADVNARPDISMLKICNDRHETLTSAGDQIVKLTCNQIYRKLALYITDEDGKPVTDDWFTSNIQLIFNEVDCNYNINAEFLRAKNAYDLGHAIPDGVFIFDFSNQGMPNFGNSRDFIDSKGLTEFWIKFNSKTKGKVKIITETLSRLV